MALVFVGKMNVPTYTSLSTDIADNAIDGASIIGGTVFLTDTAAWKIIKSDLTLADYTLPVTATISAGDIEIGAVEIKDGTTNARAAIGAHGGLVIEGVASGTTVPVSGTFYQTTQPSSDAGAAWTPVFGVSGAAVVSADITSATAITDAPTTGQKIVLTDIVVSTDTAMNILFEEETSGTDIYKVFLPANSTIQITPRSKTKLATANKKLTAKASVAGNVGITAYYYSEA